MKHASEDAVKPDLREVLAASHVAAVAIAVLLFWTVEGVLLALWAPLSRVIGFLFTAIAILDIPYFSKTFTLADRTTLVISCAYLYTALISLSAAWLLARWVYRLGPFRSLTSYCGRIFWRKHA
ncbi:MAG TPA: hypothetical protein VJN48_08705 [Terriglobales bacterium]|nr:hypothetical protein [Terriglobales bacterium]